MHMFGYGFEYGWLGMFLSMLVWVFLFLGVILLVTKIINKGDNKKSALNILDEKFASGEITEEEYKHKRDVLKS
ncbi:MAG: hypothetical protein APF76_14350 [Desulfitibacter sp. BRH_c19]|nr:MAG: hypothetical protein APF76_14350 [Desulfitibacter sp. BRH_c19]